MGFLSSIAGAIAGPLIGGLLDSNSASNATAANVGMSEQDRAAQKEFAQQGIRWRVEDAKAAGLHPLAALGAQIPAYTPSSIPVQADNSWGNAIRESGQNITRAIGAKQTRIERLQEQLLEAQIAATNADAATKNAAASQIALTSGAGMPPPMPTMSDTGMVSVSPSNRTSTFPGQQSTEAAVSPSVKLFQNADGSISMWPSGDAKQSIEDSLYEYEHMYRNRILPRLSDKFQPIYDWATSKWSKPYPKYKW